MVLGYYYMLNNGSILWKDFKDLKGVPPDVFFNSPDVKKYWMVPENIPGGSVVSGKKWCVELVAKMIVAGGKKSDIQEIAQDGLSIPLKVFNAIYREISIKEGGEDG